MDKEREHGGGTSPSVPKSHQRPPAPRPAEPHGKPPVMTPWHMFGMGGQDQPGFGRARGTCPEDLLREAAEEQHGAGDVTEAGDEPLVPDVLQLQAVLAALRDLLVL